MEFEQESLSSIMRFIYVFLLVGLLQPLRAQLVNIEARRIQSDSNKVVFNLGLAGNYSNNDGTKLLLMSTNLLSSLKSKDLKGIFLLLGNFELSKSGEQEFANSWFGHFRYNREFTPVVRGEMFLQLLNNSLLSIDLRNLLGIGPRFKLVNTAPFNLYFGSSYMHEWERSSRYDSRTQANRLSTYLSFTLKPKSSGFLFTHTAYYQPNFADWQDYRFLDELQTSLAITEHVSLTYAMRYYFDSAAPNNGYQRTLNLTCGVNFQW